GSFQGISSRRPLFAEFHRPPRRTCLSSSDTPGPLPSTRCSPAYPTTSRRSSPPRSPTVRKLAGSRSARWQRPIEPDPPPADHTLYMYTHGGGMAQGPSAPLAGFGGRELLRVIASIDSRTTGEGPLPSISGP